MDNFIIYVDRKMIEIINHSKSITFSQFDDRKLINKSTEIDIDKSEIKNVINVLKQMIE